MKANANTRRRVSHTGLGTRLVLNHHLLYLLPHLYSCNMAFSFPPNSGIGAGSTAPAGGSLFGGGGTPSLFGNTGAAAAGSNPAAAASTAGTGSTTGAPNIFNAFGARPISGRF